MSSLKVNCRQRGAHLCCLSAQRSQQRTERHRSPLARMMWRWKSITNPTPLTWSSPVSQEVNSLTPASTSSPRTSSSRSQWSKRPRRCLCQRSRRCVMGGCQCYIRISFSYECINVEKNTSSSDFFVSNVLSQWILQTLLHWTSIQFLLHKSA